MTDTGFDVVTGAFSYSGSAIARVLAECGRSIRTLTAHPERARRHDEGTEIRPLVFDDPGELTRSFEGCTTFYNTYWVRTSRGCSTHQLAVANSQKLFQAASRAGVGRIVHISITNPQLDSPYTYFAGKAMVERSLAESDTPYAIVRPAILFGGGGVFMNNIAWLLRHLPVFAIAGDGSYRVRPVHVDDLATLCVELGSTRQDTIIDAVGPESLTFRDLVLRIRAATGSRSHIVNLPPSLVVIASAILGGLLRDVLLNSQELHAMMDGLANVESDPSGDTSVTQWVQEHGSQLGIHYLNDLDLHFR